MERVQFHGSIQKANEKQEITSHRSPAWLEHTKAIIQVLCTGPNRVTNNSSSFPFCVQTVTGILGNTQLVHFINIC